MSRRKTVETVAQKQAREKALRVDGRHCPVCLALLPSLGGQPARHCPACGGHPIQEGLCARCHESRVWEGGANAGCAGCGHHGSKVRVLAGQEWLRKHPPEPPKE